MRIGLVDVDRTTWRNKHLMERSTLGKKHGDTILFPYDGAASVDKVVMSTVFTRNRPLVARWLRQLTGKDWDVSQPVFTDMELPEWIEIGGTGWNIHKKAPPEVEACKPDYSLYDAILGPANYGQGFTSRGCPRGCTFCVVPEMSGSVASPVSTLADLRNGSHKFIKLMDDNFWAPGNEWRERMLEAIQGGLEVSFTQGLDIRFLDEERAELLAQMFAKGLVWDESRANAVVTFAFDGPHIERIYRRGFDLLMKAGERNPMAAGRRKGEPSIRPVNVHSFVLTGFDTTTEQDMLRVNVLRELGAYPFVMVYEPIRGEGTPEFYLKAGWSPAQYRRHWKRCKHLQRYCNMRAVWKSVPSFEQYEPWIKQQQLWAEEDRRRGNQLAFGDMEASD